MKQVMLLVTFKNNVYNTEIDNIIFKLKQDNCVVAVEIMVEP